MQAGVLEISLVADVARIRRDMDEMRGIVSRSSKGMQQALEDVRGTMMGLFGGISVAGFGAWIKGAIDFQDHLNDLNKTTGISVEQLGGLALMAQQSGTDLEGLAKAINKMSVEMGKAPDKFRQIGITAKDPIEAFKQLSDIFVGIKDPQLRAAVAAEALGKSWASAAPALSEGSKSIDEMVKRGAELSGANGDGAAAADEFNDRVAELQMSLKGAAVQISNSMLPLLTELVKDLTDTAQSAKEADYGFDPLTETLRALAIVGGNVAFVFRGIGIEIGGIAAQIAALARGDFAQIGAIHDEMVADAEKGRAAFDAWEQKILGLGKAASTVSADFRASERAFASLEKLKGPGGAPSPSEAALRAFIDAKNAKAAEDAYESLTKKVRERIAASQLEVTLGRQLSDEEKFRVQTEAAFQELAKKYPGISKAKVQALLAESAALSQQLDIRKAEQAANAIYAKEWAKDEEDMASFEKARGDQRDKVLADLRAQREALEDNAALQDKQRSLIGASTEQRDLELGALRIQLDLERQIQKIREDRLLRPDDRERAISEAQRLAVEAKRQLSESIAIGKDSEMAEDFRGALRNGLMAGFQDGKNPAKVFAENLANAVYQRMSQRIADALTEAAFGNGKQGGGGGAGASLLGGLFSLAGGGGAQAAFSQTSVGASGFGTGMAYGNMDMGTFLHSGGIVGSEATFHRAVNDAVFHGAPRFHSGGIAGDEVPIIAQKGEGVFTKAQMRALGGGGGGNTVQITQYNSYGQMVTPGSLRQELASNNRRQQAAIERSLSYGG